MSTETLNVQQQVYPNLIDELPAQLEHQGQMTGELEEPVETKKPSWLSRLGRKIGILAIKREVGLDEGVEMINSEEQEPINFYSWEWLENFTDEVYQIGLDKNKREATLKRWPKQLPRKLMFIRLPTLKRLD